MASGSLSVQGLGFRETVFTSLNPDPRLMFFSGLPLGIHVSLGECSFGCG